MPEQRNLILAIVVSALVLVAWQFFFAMPQMQQERARQAEIAKQQAAPQQPVPTAPRVMPRPQALAQAPRSPIMTPTLDGSINLAGGRIDDLRLRQYRETLDPKSAEIEMFS